MRFKLSIFSKQRFIKQKNVANFAIKAKCKNCNFEASSYVTSAKDVDSLRIAIRYHVIRYDHEVEYEYRYREVICRNDNIIARSYKNIIEQIKRLRAK